MRNHHLRFVLCNNGQIYGGDFAKFCGLPKIYELYLEHHHKDSSLVLAVVVDFVMRLLHVHILLGQAHLQDIQERFVIKSGL